MTDPIPEPVPSSPTKPSLTVDMVDTAKSAGLPRPGAGGWTPKKLQVILISCSAAGAMAALDIATVPDITTKALGVAFGKGAVTYLVAYFGQLSAGPRKAT